MTRLIFCCALLLGAAASAQFRPPPASEAERLTYQADDLRVDAADALASGDKEKSVKKYRSALELYEKVLAQNPTLVAAGIGLGVAASAVGDHAKVVQYLEKIHAASPDELEIAYHLGLARYRLKQYPQAIPLLEQVSPALKPEHLLVHYYLGTYLLASKPEQAIVELNRYLQLRPAPLAKNDFQIQELIGRGHLQLRQPAEARAAFTAAQKGRPESLSLQMGLEVALELENRTAEAKTLLEGLTARFPKAPEPKERLGRLWLASGDGKRAEAMAQQLLAVDQGPYSQFLMGDVRLQLKQPKEAEGHLRKALQAMPNLAPAQLSLAKAIQAQGRHEEAYVLLEKVIESGLRTPDVYAVLGSVYRRAGKFQQAVAAHQKVVELLPGKALGHKLIGADHYATGQWNEAIEDFTRADAAEKDAEARHWLALALSQRAAERATAGKLDDAARDARRAFDLEATAAMGRNLGAVLLAQKAWPEASKVLTRAVGLPGATWKEGYLLGYALLNEGKPQDAVAAFEKAAAGAGAGDQLADIYAGWALCKLELGEFDTAVEKLTELSASSRAAKLTQANLPVALLRRALGRLRAGDVEGAKKDFGTVDKLPGKKTDELQQLSHFVRGLIALEDGEFPAAQGAFAKAITKQSRWAPPFARGLVEGYLEYRKGRFPQSRKALGKLGKNAAPALAAHLAELTRAVDRRDGETAYKKGSVGAAEKALTSAGSSDPLNPYVIHNLACVAERKGKSEDAIKAWEGVSATLPTALLNLGINAQEKQKDYARAFELYGKFLPAAGERAALVTGWRSRLASIYGLADDPAEDDEPLKPSPTVVEPTSP